MIGLISLRSAAMVIARMVACLRATRTPGFCARGRAAPWRRGIFVFGRNRSTVKRSQAVSFGSGWASKPRGTTYTECRLIVRLERPYRLGVLRFASPTPRAKRIVSVSDLVDPGQKEHSLLKRFQAAGAPNMCSARWHVGHARITSPRVVPDRLVPPAPSGFRWWTSRQSFANGP